MAGMIAAVNKHRKPHPRIIVQKSASQTESACLYCTFFPDSRQCRVPAFCAQNRMISGIRTYVFSPAFASRPAPASRLSPRGRRRGSIPPILLPLLCVLFYEIFIPFFLLSEAAEDLCGFNVHAIPAVPYLHFPLLGISGDERKQSFDNRPSGIRASQDASFAPAIPPDHASPASDGDPRMYGSLKNQPV